MIDRAIYANANALDLPIADKSVHMIATSPPYWGLRSYDTGDNKHAELGAEKLHDCLAWARGADPCGGCYVCNMRTWAREMWRVLRDDGVMFLNLGDSYIGYKGANYGVNPETSKLQSKSTVPKAHMIGTPQTCNLKSKDLTGIPWRVALALQADGWYLRSDIIWAKPNPMPESVTDRPTKAHEYVFLLTKAARYYWDAEAVREPHSREWGGENGLMGMNTWATDAGRNDCNRAAPPQFNPAGRNARTVWTIATQPFSGAHFATWPPALVERMIKAGSSERGACPECGKPWERVVEREYGTPAYREDRQVATGGAITGGVGKNFREVTASNMIWRPTCDHAADPIPATVLDPFAGSGTTLMVARQLGRIGLGFDLSLSYLEDVARVRLGHDKLAAWGNGIKGDSSDDWDGPLLIWREDVA